MPSLNFLRRRKKGRLDALDVIRKEMSANLRTYESHLKQVQTSYEQIRDIMVNERSNIDRNSRLSERMYLALKREGIIKGDEPVGE